MAMTKQTKREQRPADVGKAQSPAMAEQQPEPIPPLPAGWRAVNSPLRRPLTFQASATRLVLTVELEKRVRETDRPPVLAYQQAGRELFGDKVAELVSGDVRATAEYAGFIALRGEIADTERRLRLAEAAVRKCTAERELAEGGDVKGLADRLQALDEAEAKALRHQRELEGSLARLRPVLVRRKGEVEGLLPGFVSTRSTEVRAQVTQQEAEALEEFVAQASATLDRLMALAVARRRGYDSDGTDQALGGLLERLASAEAAAAPTAEASA